MVLLTVLSEQLCRGWEGEEIFGVMILRFPAGWHLDGYWRGANRSRKRSSCGEDDGWAWSLGSVKFQMPVLHLHGEKSVRDYVFHILSDFMCICIIMFSGFFFLV